MRTNNLSNFDIQIFKILDNSASIVVEVTLALSSHSCRGSVVATTALLHTTTTARFVYSVIYRIGWMYIIPTITILLKMGMTYHLDLFAS